MSESEPLDLSFLLEALANGVKSVQTLPVKDDFEFQASLPEFSSSLNETQSVLLETLMEHLDYEGTMIQDPSLWEACVDACEELTLQIEANLSSDNSAVQNIRASSDKFSQMVSQMADMEKPQNIYHFWKTDNGRTVPFVPLIERKPHAVAAIDLEPREGHGLNTISRIGQGTSIPDDIQAPSVHHVHPYEPEILALQYTIEQLEARPQPPIKALEKLQATWVDSPLALKELSDKLKQSKVIAIDLEAHSYRSFAGMACLMQISLRNTESQVENYLIDTIVLKPFLQEHLLDPFVNPHIVKVLHGADSDVLWLQQHFGLYLVNMFDTRRACDELRLKRSSFAYLLQRYVGIVADKSYQMADWRTRPLSEALQHYATQDTAYLLDIYEHLKYDLERSAFTEVRKVLDVSKKVCLGRYGGQPFRPSGFQRLISNNRSGRTKRQWNQRQKDVLKALWDWRDAAARTCDESAIYICSNTALIRMAMACPTNVGALQNLFNPMPSIILQQAGTIVEYIRSVTAKPEPRLMSPVLGTQALYRQAGWMTQQEEEQDDSRRTLELNTANANFATSSGGMDLGTTPTNTEKDKVLPAVFGAVPIFGDKDADMQDDDDDDEEEEEQKLMEEEEDFPIPRSMREIYKISNRNRRLKKATSPERGPVVEQDELAKAEELLRQRGVNYFEEKKARTEDATADDLQFMQDIGWIPDKQAADVLMDQRYGRKPASAPEEVNPFFGGPVSRSRSARGGRKGRPGSSRQQERPKREEGRSHAYRSSAGSKR